MIGERSLSLCLTNIHLRINKIAHKKTDKSSEAHNELLSLFFICEFNLSYGMLIPKGSSSIFRSINPHEKYYYQSHLKHIHP